MTPNGINFFMICFILITSTQASINLALNKPAFQSSTFPLFNWTANLAVDGGANSVVTNNECSVTSDRDPPPEVAWWYVDLEQTSRIKSVKIIVRTDGADGPERLAGYDIFVSPTEAVTVPGTHSGHVCFNHTGPVLPTGDQDRECDLLGRFVSIYNERFQNVTYPSLYNGFAILELCEVEVFGCPIGKYGDGNCNETCSVGCNQMDCDSVNGTCMFGCKSGWTNETCTNCDDGYYGMNCSELCSPGCNRTCDKQNGECGNECLDGFNGTKCDICCDGFYGMACNITCPVRCNATTCDKMEGTCSGSCNQGWTGALCDVQVQVTNEAISEDDIIIPVVLGSVGGVILLIIIIAVVCTTRKKKQKKRQRNFHDGPYQSEFVEPYVTSNRLSQSKPQQTDISGVRL